MSKNDVSNNVIQEAKTILDLYNTATKEKMMGYMLPVFVNEQYPDLTTDKGNQLVENVRRMKTNPEFRRTIISTAGKVDEPLLETHQHKSLSNWFHMYTVNNKMLPVFSFNSTDSINNEIFREGKDIKKYKNAIIDRIENMDPIELGLGLYKERENDTNSYIIVDDKPNTFEIRKELREGVESFEKYNGVYPTSFSVSDIPIYFVIIAGAERGFHASIYILLNNQVFTIGFGYLGFDGKKTSELLYSVEEKTTIPVSEFGTKPSSLYSPDFVINPDLKNRIVDMNVLTSTHLSNLQNYVGSATTLTVDVKFNKSEVAHIERVQLSGLPQKYLKTSSNFMSNYYQNCASFITSIFSNINCQANVPITPSIPSWCNTNPPISKEYISYAFNVFRDTSTPSHLNAIKILKVLNESSTIRGGKKRRPRTLKKSKNVRHRRGKRGKTKRNK